MYWVPSLVDVAFEANVEALHWVVIDTDRWLNDDGE